VTVKIRRKYSNYTGVQFAEVDVDGRLVTVRTRGDRAGRLENAWGDRYPFGETRAAPIKAMAERMAAEGRAHNPGKRARRLRGMARHQERLEAEARAWDVARGRRRFDRAGYMNRTYRRRRRNPMGHGEWIDILVPLVAVFLLVRGGVLKTGTT
jgi:hypothetical protein